MSFVINLRDLFDNINKTQKGETKFMSIVCTKNLKKVYRMGENMVYALAGVDFSAEQGEFVAIAGPSGGVKSTLLNMLGALDKPTEGEVVIRDCKISEMSQDKQTIFRRRNIGFVFQNFALMDYYTAYENIELPLLVKNVKRSERKRIIEEKMNYLGITDVKDKIPAKMSGGQQQRVAIARALVTDCDILLADEPTGALDQNTGKEVMKYLREINNDGKTVIVVTHDSQVADMTDRTIVICDGKVVEDRKKEMFSLKEE